MTRPGSVAIAVLTGALSIQAQRQTGSPAGIPIPAPPAPAATSPIQGSAAAPNVFRIHVVDGRTGDAIAGAHLQIWYDEPVGMGYAATTGGSGDALMPKPVGDPLRVLVKVHGYTDCRRPDRDAAPEGYNLASIAASGVTAQNTCGRVTVRTGPGELVLSVRSSRWYENLNKTAPQ